MSTATYAACVKCRAERYVKGRGLCSPCYRVEQMSGTLARWAPDRVDRQQQVADLYAEGVTRPRDIADALGISVNAAEITLGRVKRGGRVTPVAPPPHAAWLTPLPPAPTRPPCAGEVMDFDGLQPHELTPSRNMHVAAGLALCAQCPLATRQWCLDVMQPQTLGREWQGIAGGVVFSHGRVVYMPAEAVAVAS